MDSSELFLAANVELLGISAADREKIEAAADFAVDIVQSPAGSPLLKVGGRQMYHPQTPISTVKKEVDGLQGDDDADVVALFGFGLGYHAEQLERRFKGRIVVYDPVLGILRAALGARLVPLQRTVVVTDTAELLAQVQYNLQFSDHKVLAAAIPLYTELFAPELAQFKRVLQEAMESAWIMENTASDRTVEWVGYVAQNLPRAVRCPGLEILADRFKGRPGIVVSAGPSLDKNVALLRDAIDRALIISVNAAAAALARAEVVPDIIAVVESLDLRAQFSRVSAWDKISLAPTISSFPGFFDLPARHLFPLVDSSIPCGDWLIEALGWRSFPSGGSVACTAFSILHALGCDPLILVGQDLAYTGGNSYTSGATFGRQRMTYDPVAKILTQVERSGEIEAIRSAGGLDLMVQVKAVEVEAWGGEGMVASSPMFNMFRSWFEATAVTWGKDRTLINATEGGGRLRGFAEIPLAEVLQRYCREPFFPKNQIDQAVAAWSPPPLDGLLTLIEHNISDISQTRTLAREGMTAAEQASAILRQAGFGEAEPELRRLSLIEGGLRQKARENPILDTFIAGRINRLRAARTADLNPDPLRQALQSLARTQTMFGVISDGAAELVELFAGVKARITGSGETPFSPD